MSRARRMETAPRWNPISSLSDLEEKYVSAFHKSDSLLEVPGDQPEEVGVVLEA